MPAAATMAGDGGADADPAAVSAQFHCAVAFVRGGSSNSNAPRPSAGDLLRMYALYKQATDGPCNTQKPGFLDVVGRQKWQAWKDLGDLPKIEAQQRYVNKIKQMSADREAEPAVARFLAELKRLQLPVGSGGTHGADAAANGSLAAIHGKAQAHDSHDTNDKHETKDKDEEEDDEGDDGDGGDDSNDDDDGDGPPPATSTPIRGNDGSFQSLEPGMQDSSGDHYGSSLQSPVSLEDTWASGATMHKDKPSTSRSLFPLAGSFLEESRTTAAAAPVVRSDDVFVVSHTNEDVTRALAALQQNLQRTSERVRALEQRFGGTEGERAATSSSSPSSSSRPRGLFAWLQQLSAGLSTGSVVLIAVLWPIVLQLIFYLLRRRNQRNQRK